MTGDDDDVWGAGVWEVVALKKLQPVGNPPVGGREGGRERGREGGREGGRASVKRSSKSLLSGEGTAGKEGEC